MVRRTPPISVSGRSSIRRKLVVPLDTHVHRIATFLGLSDRKSADWKAARAMTDRLARFDAPIPVRYDFALCRLGILDLCSRKRRKENCDVCLLRDVCPCRFPSPLPALRGGSSNQKSAGRIQPLVGAKAESSSEIHGRFNVSNQRISRRFSRGTAVESPSRPMRVAPGHERADRRPDGGGDPRRVRLVPAQALLVRAHRLHVPARQRRRSSSRPSIPAAAPRTPDCAPGDRIWLIGDTPTTEVEGCRRRSAGSVRPCRWSSSARRKRYAPSSTARPS